MAFAVPVLKKDYNLYGNRGKKPTLSAAAYGRKAASTNHLSNRGKLRTGTIATAGGSTGAIPNMTMTPAKQPIAVSRRRFISYPAGVVETEADNKVKLVANNQQTREKLSEVVLSDRQFDRRHVRFGTFQQFHLRNEALKEEEEGEEDDDGHNSDMNDTENEQNSSSKTECPAGGQLPTADHADSDCDSAYGECSELEESGSSGHGTRDKTSAVRRQVSRESDSTGTSKSQASKQANTNCGTVFLYLAKCTPKN